MQTTGYYRRRRGVYEHILDGRMSLLDNSFHDILCQQADASTGIVWTSAAQLHHELGISRKLAQKYLCRLERKGYIRRFRKARSRASQATLIHLYECTALPHKGKFLDAWRSESWQQCTYISGIQSGIHGGIQSGIHRAAEPYRNLEIYKSKKIPAANPAAPATPADIRQPLSEGEQRRRIAKRDERLAREAEVHREAMVGSGPSDWAFDRQNHTEKPAEVSTAGATAAQNAPPASAPPITRARDIQTGEAEANKEVSTAAGPQGLDVDTRARAVAAAASEGRELSWDEARELHLLKAKLRSLGNPHQNTA